MDLVQIVVIGMILTILATVTLAVVSYAAFRMRQHRSPVRGESAQESPLFFERAPVGPGHASREG